MNIFTVLIVGAIESTLIPSYLIVAVDTVTFESVNDVDASAERALSLEVKFSIVLSLNTDDFEPISDVRDTVVLSDVKDDTYRPDTIMFEA